MAATHRFLLTLQLGMPIPCIAVCALAVGISVTGCQEKTEASNTPKNFDTHLQQDTVAIHPISDISSDTSVVSHPQVLPVTDTSTHNIVVQKLSDTTPAPSSAMAVLPSFPTKETDNTLDNNLSSQNFAETFAQNAFFVNGFHAISTSNKYQQLYINTIQEMSKKMLNETGDADTLFVKNMLLHHQAALNFATIELKYGKDETLQSLAQDTLTSQQAEANLLSQWLKNHANKKPTNNLKALQIEYNQNIQDMNNAMLKGVSVSTADRAFAQVLLPHHKGALAMAETELSYGKDKVVKELAVNIISSQQGEITLMKNWLASQHKH